MILASGDEAILDSLQEHRFLQSGQLSRLLGRSSQVIRRRLRRLAAEEYVLPLERRPAEQAAYALGPEGFMWAAERLGVEVSELPFSRRITAQKTRSPFWRHELRVVDTVISFILSSAKEGAPAGLSRIIREWEMENPRSRAHHEKFLLSMRMEEAGRVHFHRPDACLLLHSKERGPEACVAAFVELDRGTETNGRLKKKLDAYRLYMERGLFQRQFGAVGMRVLFVFDLPTTRRLEHLQAQLGVYAESSEPVRQRVASAVRLTRMEDLRRDALSAPIWRSFDSKTPAPLVHSGVRPARIGPPCHA